MDWKKTVLLLLFGLSLTFCARFPLRKYFYIFTRKTWQDAQLYCREKYTDLATFESMEDLNQLSRPAGFTDRVWIGLHDDPASWKGTLGNDSNSWRWSTTGQPITSQYTNWMSGEPNALRGEEPYVYVTSDGVWDDAPAEWVLSCLCYTDNGQNQKTYVLIPDKRTWSDAQSYCRQHHTDLALITSSEESSRAQSVKTTTYASWIGLYRAPWTWSDKNPSTFTNWASGQPENCFASEFCVYEDENHVWGDYNCHNQIYFLCHEVRELTTTLKMKMKMKTTADLTDPAVSQQIVQKLNEVLESQGWTNLKLQWTTPPGKVVEDSDQVKAVCL